jgi:hypothetical protein
MSDEEDGKLLKQIDEKLGMLISLNAVSLSANKELDNPTKVRLLSLAGFTSDEIGEMIGVRADTVRHIRSEAGQKKATRKELDRKSSKDTSKGGESSAK